MKIIVFSGIVAVWRRDLLFFADAFLSELAVQVERSVLDEISISEAESV